MLVDIDGVISVWGWSHQEPVDGAWALVDGIPHFLATGPAERLRALREHFSLVWCSGWQERANEHLPALLALGPLPHLSFRRPTAGTPPPAHWKLDAIEAHVGPHRAVAWVDDDLNAACHEWARERPGPTLLVTTDPAMGLTAAQAAELGAWAARLGAGGPG